MDDATIEDEAELDEEPSAKLQGQHSLLPWSYIIEIVTKQWVMFFIISLAVAVYLYVSLHRRRQRRDESSSIRHDHVQGGTDGQRVSHDLERRFDDLNRARQRQQQAYEQQALLAAERKKQKAEAMNETNKQSKYKSDNYNPLTGQSTADSCSWKSSSSRRTTGG